MSGNRGRKSLFWLPKDGKDPGNYSALAYYFRAAYQEVAK